MTIAQDIVTESGRVSDNRGFYCAVLSARLVIEVPGRTENPLLFRLSRTVFEI